MTLIVHRKDHNPIQSSRFFPKIREIAKERGLKVIGVVYTDNRPRDTQDPNDDGGWICHKCDASHPRTNLTFEEGHPDILMDCPGCGYPFLIIKT